MAPKQLAGTKHSKINVISQNVQIYMQYKIYHQMAQSVEKHLLETTGLFENAVAGTGNNIPEGCDLTIFESATFEGKLKINNALSFPGTLDTTGDFSALNFTVASGAQIIQSTSATGNF